jgi:arsenate reductase
VTTRRRGCPLWPGQPISAHWGIEDPAAVEGSDVDKERAFVTAFRYLKNRFRFWSICRRVAEPSRAHHQAAGHRRVEGSTSKNPQVA